MRIILLFLIFAPAARAADLNLALKDAEQAALASSGQYQGARLSAEAAAAGAAAASSLPYPRLSLEGSLRYAHVVPEIAMPAALGGARPLGDNWNYNLGPSAYWTLDAGALRYGRDAARRTAAARSAEAEAARRQALLKARAAYFRLQLALEKVYLAAGSMKLSVEQLKDVELGVKAGSRSRLDGLRARQEATARRRDLLRARMDLAAALRDLSYETGLKLPESDLLPLDARLECYDEPCDESRLIRVRAEPFGDLLTALMPVAGRPLGDDLPAVRSLEETSAALGASALARKKERLPRLTLAARSALEYPNGPNLYSFWQNSASLSLNLPLFEGGRLADLERESRLNSQAAAARRDDARRAAARDYAAALGDYNALTEEQALDVEALDDADETARLVYKTYKGGGATWLEVESANLKLTQAGTALAAVNAEILLKLAVLDSLTGSVK